MTKLLLLFLLLFPYQSNQNATPLEVRVGRRERPLAQLAYARRLKRTMYGRPPEDRPFWTGLAVEAYQAVREFHPDAPELGAEAAFRAGELLRAAGKIEDAVQEFRVAAELGRGTQFRPRARLEIGHIERRSGNLRRALDQYLGVASSAGSDPLQRDDAWLWAGRVWSAEGRLNDARRAWRGVAEADGHPLDRIQAFDELGLSWLEQGDDERAFIELETCREALGDQALEETQLGVRVRSALLRMRTQVALQQEIGLKRKDKKVEKTLTR